MQVRPHAPLVQTSLPSVVVPVARQPHPTGAHGLQTLGVPGFPPPQVWPGGQGAPQLTLPPHPSGTVPQLAPPGQVVIRVQPQRFAVPGLPPPHVSKPVQLPQSSCGPSQPSSMRPQFAFWAAQVVLVQHWSLALQTSVLAGQQPLPVQMTPEGQTQLPLWQRYPGRPQASPSGAVGVEQTPVSGLQTPRTWQASRGVQTTGLRPTQRPSWQRSVWVQASPSLQVVPSATGSH